jgi:hypothetical protein
MQMTGLRKEHSMKHLTTKVACTRDLTKLAGQLRWIRRSVLSLRARVPSVGLGLLLVTFCVPSPPLAGPVVIHGIFYTPISSAVAARRTPHAWYGPAKSTQFGVYFVFYFFFRFFFPFPFPFIFLFLFCFFFHFTFYSFFLFFVQIQKLFKFQKCLNLKIIQIQKII